MERSNGMSLQRLDGAALRERVVALIMRVLGDSYDPAKHRLELTSLQVLELIVALEDEFGIHISEDAPSGRITSSVDSILKYLRTAVAELE
jgi:acyl carrier protein